MSVWHQHPGVRTGNELSFGERAAVEVALHTLDNTKEVKELVIANIVLTQQVHDLTIMVKSHLMGG